jgi:two-component system chemotaxis response regulator CheB
MSFYNEKISIPFFPATSRTRKRILVADDSALARLFVRDVLLSEGFEVILAKNGKEALELASISRPDAAVLDVNMPVMDGISVLKEFVNMKIPSIMFSSMTTESSRVTIEALEIGAVDFVTKPGSSAALDVEEIKDDLIMKVKIAILSKVFPSFKAQHEKVISISSSSSSSYSSSLSLSLQAGASPERVAERAVIIAASTGGPSMVRSVIGALRPPIGAAVLVVQHMPPLFTKAFAESLAKKSSLSVKEAELGEEICEDKVYVAPGDYHMAVSPDMRVILHKGEKVNFVRPAADVLMYSAAKYFGPSSIAVILSGMGCDGAKGALAIKRAGGHVIVQDEATSVVYGMPRAAVEAGAAEDILPIGDIPEKILRLLKKI